MGSIFRNNSNNLDDFEIISIYFAIKLVTYESI